MQVKQTFISPPVMIISLAMNLQYQPVFLPVMHILSVVSELCIVCLGLLYLWPLSIVWNSDQDTSSEKLIIFPSPCEKMWVLNEEITSVTGQCVKDLRLSVVLQWGWILRMWHCVVGWVDLIFRSIVIPSSSLSNSPWRMTASPWGWRHYDHSRCWELLTQQHSIISLKTSCTPSHQSNWDGKRSYFIPFMILIVSRNSVILSSFYHC